MSDPNAPQPGDAGITPPVPPASQPGAAVPPPAAYPPPSSATPPPAAPPAGAYAAAPAAPLSPDSDRQAAMWAHIGGIVGFLPSLIIWLLLKDRGPRTAVEAKEALNWQITWTIGYIAILIITSILGAIFWGLGVLASLLPLAWWVVNIVFSVQGGMRVNAGGGYRYPFNLRLIK